MKVVFGYPPNIGKIKAKLNPSIRAIFTYGDTIFVPDSGRLDEALTAHEETHMRQQGEDSEGWWDKYLESEQFRLQQELEAYRKQYKVFKKGKDRNKIFMFLHKIATDLSGELYGNIISYEEAKKKII